MSGQAWGRIFTDVFQENVLKANHKKTDAGRHWLDWAWDQRIGSIVTGQRTVFIVLLILIHSVAPKLINRF